MADDGKAVPWLQLLGYRQTWAFALGKFLTDGVWWRALVPRHKDVEV